MGSNPIGVAFYNYFTRLTHKVMKTTGVSYHPVCGEKAYSSLVMSVREGFEALEKEKLFSLSNVLLFEPQPIAEELLGKAHAREWIENVKKSGYWETSLYSIGGLVEATEKVLSKAIDNALVFIGAGGYHVHRDYARGGCFFNQTAIAILHAREKLATKKFAIVDTDTHHADDSRDIFKDDESVLHVCFC